MIAPIYCIEGGGVKLAWSHFGASQNNETNSDLFHWDNWWQKKDKNNSTKVKILRFKTVDYNVFSLVLSLTKIGWQVIFK
jgi:hypothetical protein